MVLAADDASDEYGDKYALVVLDKYAVAIMAYPAKHMDAETTKASFLEFLVPQRRRETYMRRRIWRATKGMSSLGLAARYRRTTSARDRWKGRARGQLSYSASAVLRNSGLGHGWWKEPMQA
eukprot:5253822-Pyramimonas_sp.AAC.1